MRVGVGIRSSLIILGDSSGGYCSYEEEMTNQEIVGPGQAVWVTRQETRRDSQEHTAGAEYLNQELVSDSNINSSVHDTEDYGEGKDGTGSGTHD